MNDILVINCLTSLKQYLANNWKRFQKKVIFLNGELGSGKTTFVKTLAPFLEAGISIKSPSFNVMHSYQNIVHLDLYNHHGDLSFFEDYFEDKTVFIEWANRLDYQLQADVIININKSSNNYIYQIEFIEENKMKNQNTENENEKVISKILKTNLEIKKLINVIVAEFIRTTLEAELSTYLGYSKWDQESRHKSDNYRNGYSKRIFRFSTGKINTKIPRDKNRTFTTKLIKKYQSDVTIIESKVPVLFAKNLSQNAINQQLAWIYNLANNDQWLLSMQSKIQHNLKTWNSRLLEKRYDAIFINKLSFRTIRKGLKQELILNVLSAFNKIRQREILSLWVWRKDTVNYWNKIFKDLEARGVEFVETLFAETSAFLKDAIEILILKGFLKNKQIKSIY